MFCTSSSLLTKVISMQVLPGNTTQALICVNAQVQPALVRSLCQECPTVISPSTCTVCVSACLEACLRPGALPSY